MILLELNNIVHLAFTALLAARSVACLTRVVPCGADHFQQLA